MNTINGLDDINLKLMRQQPLSTNSILKLGNLWRPKLLLEGINKKYNN